MSKFSKDKYLKGRSLTFSDTWPDFQITYLKRNRIVHEKRHLIQPLMKTLWQIWLLYCILQIYTENVFHYAWFQLNWTNWYLVNWCILIETLGTCRRKEEIAVILCVVSRFTTRSLPNRKFSSNIQDLSNTFLSYVNPLETRLGFLSDTQHKTWEPLAFKLQHLDIPTY